MRVAVIGGGAAGMYAAIGLADAGHTVTIYEKNEKLGKKLFITGKGRCNLTNNCEVEELMKHVVTNPKFLYSAFYQCNAQDVMQFFEKNGLELKTERGNRVFPASDHSSDVIKTLEQALKKRNVTVCLHHTVTKILTEQIQEQTRAVGVCVQEEKGKTKQERFDAVIVATGGLSYERTGSTGDGMQFARDLGLQVTECQPSLVPFEIEEDFCRDLMGLSLRNVTLSCYTKKKNKDKILYQEQGEMLFTHFGISGPLVLSASAYAGKAKGEPIWVEIDLKPALTAEQLDARILRDFDVAKNKQMRNALDELLPKKLIPVMIELAEIDPFKQVNAVTKEERERLVICMKKLALHVVGTRGYEEAIITRGGVSVKEINPKTMEAKQIPGLYFIGEVLDVDALTGGFNLQIAWATAATVLLSEEYRNLFGGTENMNIAIDGPAGAGKSTIARRVAKEKGYIYVDTGAMYRAIGLYFMNEGVDAENAAAVFEALAAIHVEIKYEAGEQQVYLNGKNVSKEIRQEAVGNMASKVATKQAVRDKLLDLQRNLAATQDVVMDGRDIGTFVLPDAELKIYLTASVDTRADRRYKELVEKQVPADLEEIKRDIEARDYQDMHREIAPLTQAEDAYYLDSSEMAIDEVVAEIIGKIPE